MDSQLKHNHSISRSGVIFWTTSNASIYTAANELTFSSLLSLICSDVQQV